MGLESVTYISDLVATNPVGATDPKSQGDDHLRNIKLALLNTFPNITGEVVATHAQISALAGGTLAAANGSNLTNLNASNIASGTLADARLSANIPKLNAANTFTSAQLISASTQFPLALVNTSAPEDGRRWNVVIPNNGPLEIRAADDEGSTQASPLRIVRNGSSIDEIELNATTLDFNGDADISGTLAVGGTINGNGSGLTSLNASNLSSGTVAGARLGGNQTMDGNKTFSGSVTIVGAATAGTAATSTSATLAAGQIHNRSANTTVNNLGAGRWVAVQNTSTSAITLSEGSGVTLELGGTTTTGNRTLGPKGFAFIYFRADNTATVQGSGVS